jgi:hypothetical protein
MAGVEVAPSERPTLGVGEHEAVHGSHVRRDPAGFRILAALVAGITTTGRVVMDSGSGAAYSAAR